MSRLGEPTDKEALIDGRPTELLQTWLRVAYGWRDWSRKHPGIPDDPEYGNERWIAELEHELKRRGEKF